MYTSVSVRYPSRRRIRLRTHLAGATKVQDSSLLLLSLFASSGGFFFLPSFFSDRQGPEGRLVDYSVAPKIILNQSYPLIVVRVVTHTGRSSHRATNELQWSRSRPVEHSVTTDRASASARSRDLDVDHCQKPGMVLEEAVTNGYDVRRKASRSRLRGLEAVFLTRHSMTQESVLGIPAR